MDLLDFFRGVHTWRRLLVLLAGLPPRSRLAIAQAEDDELAEQYLQLYGDKDQPARAPHLGEYGPEAQRLDRLINAAEAIFKRISDALGAKTTLPPPPPQPRTAIERARERASMARLEALTDEVHAAMRRGT